MLVSLFWCNKVNSIYSNQRANVIRSRAIYEYIHMSKVYMLINTKYALVRLLSKYITKWKESNKIVRAPLITRNYGF